jgi:hypothetical protein
LLLYFTSFTDWINTTKPAVLMELAPYDGGSPVASDIGASRDRNGGIDSASVGESKGDVRLPNVAGDDVRSGDVRLVVVSEASSVSCDLVGDGRAERAVK